MRPASSLFLFIGAAPQTDWLPEKVMRDPNGFVLSGRDLRIDGQLAAHMERGSGAVFARDVDAWSFCSRRCAARFREAGGDSGWRRFDGGAADASIFGAVLMGQEQMEGTTAEARARTITQQELSQLVRRVPILSKLKEARPGMHGRRGAAGGSGGNAAVRAGEEHPGVLHDPRGRNPRHPHRDQRHRDAASRFSTMGTRLARHRC